MTNSNSPRLLKGLASALCLSLIAFGLPVSMVAWNAEPPLKSAISLMGHPGQLIHGLSQPITARNVSQIAITIAWFVWLWFLTALAVELIARTRGVTSRKFQCFGRGQAIIALMIGAIFPIVGPLRLSTHSRTETELRETAALSLAAFSSRNEVISDSPGQPEAQNVSLNILDSASYIVYTVVKGDTLWSIAAEELGSPLRWTQIAELNYGRIQADGEAFTNDNWILPGWQLLLPSAEGSVQGSTDSSRVDSGGATVESARFTPVGRNLVSRVSTSLEDANPDKEPDLELSQMRLLDERARNRTPTDLGQSAVPFAPIGYGLLAAGLVTTLVKLRRKQQRHRRTGMRIALPSGEIASIERSLRLSSDSVGTDWVDLALSVLAAEARRRFEIPPRVVAVKMSDQSLELVLDIDGDPPAPWLPFRSRKDGPQEIWCLPREKAVADSLRENVWLVGIDPPFPSMVTVGNDGEATFLVDLELAASIAVEGEAADTLLLAMIVELASAQWADRVEIVAVGFDKDLNRFERVRTVDRLSEIVGMVTSRQAERELLLASVKTRQTWESRMSQGGDAWDLTVVFCSRSTTLEEKAEALRLIESVGTASHGVAVVVAGDEVPARWHLQCTGDKLNFKSGELRGLEIWPQRLEPDVARNIGELIATASDIDGVADAAPPYDRLFDHWSIAPSEETKIAVPQEEVEFSESRNCSERSLPIQADTRRSLVGVGEGPGTAGESGQSEPSNRPEVEILVLGPVEILGADRPFTRAWAVDLVVYLSMHAAGVSNDQWATALWPDRLMAPSSLHSTASAARRSLGTDVHGQDHLPRSHGRLALRSSVGSDWSRFESLAASPDPSDWRRAIELIRGRPFEGLRASDWTLLEGIVASIEASVVDLSCRYAEHCLSQDDSRGAAWAARQGLKVSAYDERLYRALMQAANVAGNPAGVESIFAELVRLVADDVEPYDAVHPETLALYRQLSRRSGPGRRAG